MARSAADLPEEIRLAGEEWARADGDARRLDSIRKRTFSAIVINSEGKSVSMNEHIARVSPTFEAAESAAVQAETDANIAKAKLEAMRLTFEFWRTAESSRRAEMNLR